VPEPLWQVGPLSDGAAPRYGFTRFAAQLNEMTGVERGRLPPTDSRLRPDQRALEDGDMERAEQLKARLEERQRARRREMEERGMSGCRGGLSSPGGMGMRRFGG